MHEAFAGALDAALDEIARDPDGRRERGASGRPRWPMIVLRTPEGLDRPGGGRRPAGRGHVARRTRCRSPTCATTPSTCAARGVAAQLPARGAVRRARARSSPELRGARARGRPAHEREPARERRRAPARSRAARLPRLRGRRAESRGPSSARRRASSARSSRDVIARNPDELPPLRPGRDGVEPARRRLRGRPTEGLGGRDRADRRAPRSGRARARGALGAPLPGLARGLPADRAGTGSSTATRRSSTSSTRCSTSTRSG